MSGCISFWRRALITMEPVLTMGLWGRSEEVSAIWVYRVDGKKVSYRITAIVQFQGVELSP